MAILVVDDQSVSLQLLCEVIRPVTDGHIIRPFASPLVALDWAAENPVVMVLTDYKMPEIDGFEFTRRLRRLPGCAHVPVIVISVNNHPDMAEMAADAGATLFLEKPVNHSECRELCQALLKEGEKVD